MGALNTIETINTIVVVVSVSAGLCLAGWLLFHNHNRCIWDKMLREFQERFPGRCPICSFHFWGFECGREKFREPPEHNCIEKHNK